jgi:hypothetical protein
MNQQPAEIQVKDIEHLGIVAGIIDQMGWVDAVNELVGVHSLFPSEYRSSAQSNDSQRSGFRGCAVVFIQ